MDSSNPQHHKGIDIGVPADTPIAAAIGGVVSEVGYSPSWGNYLRYLTDDNKIVIYAHLNKTLKKADERIEQGETVALSGNTGQSTGPHLHFGVYERGSGIDVDPLRFTKESDYKP